LATGQREFFSKKNPATFWRAFKPIVSKYGNSKAGEEKKNIPRKLAGNFGDFFFSFLFSKKTPLYELHRISFYAK
jgi:hypothetical protein